MAFLTGITPSPAVVRGQNARMEALSFIERPCGCELAKPWCQKGHRRPSDDFVSVLLCQAVRAQRKLLSKADAINELDPPPARLEAVL